ncbi:MAG TPA: UrcA family protein [Rhizomicrobium sp.]|jgi:UrcA family protein
MIRNVLRISAVAIVASGLMGAFSLPTMAGDRSVRVTSWDLDLTTDAGRDTFARRIAHAVDQVCGPSGGVTMDERMNYQSCSNTAQAGAMTQMEVAVRAARERKVATAQ